MARALIDGETFSAAAGALSGNRDTSGSDKQFNADLFYSINPGRWYKTFPFFFEVTLKKKLVYRMFLPIPPQSLTVQDMSTSEAHATLGGVVEETSKPVFYQVTLVGTTGLSVNGNGLSHTDSTLSPTFRKYVDDTTGRDNPLKKLVGGLVDIPGQLASAFTEPEAQLPYGDYPSAVASKKFDITSLIPVDANKSSEANGFVEKLKKNFDFTSGILNPPGDKNGNSPFANGYSWGHALRQFFLVYQREKEANSELELYFTDVKSNTRYRCVPRGVQFQRQASNPYMANYNITLKCWNLENSSVKPESAEIDRFKSDLKEVFTVSVTGAISRVGNSIRSLKRGKDIGGALARNSFGSSI
jgi:hypothetical protein